MGRVWLKSSFKWWALGIGVALVVGAIIMAATEVDWSTLRQAEPWQFAVMAAAVAANLLLIAALWWLVTLSFDARPPVGPVKMFALVSASGLLNYLPLRAGLIGRAAYLKMKHDLPLRQSGVIMLVIMGLSGLVLGMAAAIVLMIPPPVQTGAAASLGVLAMLVVPIAARRLLRRKTKGALLWVPLRAADLLVTAARLWVAFRIVGEAITPAQAVFAASAGLFVSLLGITPNGLGLREWAIAGATAGEFGHAGFAAAVIDRGVEAIIVTLAGLWALQRVGLREQIAAARSKKGR